MNPITKITLGGMTAHILYDLNLAPFSQGRTHLYPLVGIVEIPPAHRSMVGTQTLAVQWNMKGECVIFNTGVNRYIRANQYDWSV